MAEQNIELPESVLEGVGESMWQGGLAAIVTGGIATAITLPAKTKEAKIKAAADMQEVARKAAGSSSLDEFNEKNKR